MNKKNNGIAILIGALAIGGAYYYFTMTKQAYARIIAKNTGVDYRKYMNYDKDYLKARAKAFKGNQETFMVGVQTYSTETGRVKQ